MVRDSAVLDPTVVLSTVAAITARVRLGAGIELAPSYPPAVLARTLATLNVVSHGQVADHVGATRRVGAHEIVLGLGGDPSLDQVLDAYARVAEAADVRAAVAS